MGIGTVSAAVKLDVSGSINAKTEIAGVPTVNLYGTTGINGGNADISLTNAAGTAGWFPGVNGSNGTLSFYDTSSTTRPLTIEDNAPSSLYVYSTGKVKVGNTGVAVQGMGTCSIAVFAAVFGANSKISTGVASSANNSRNKNLWNLRRHRQRFKRFQVPFLRSQKRNLEPFEKRVVYIQYTKKFITHCT